MRAFFTLLGILFFSLAMGQGNSFTLSQETLGQREHFFNLKDGDILNLNGFLPENFYNITLISESNCLPILTPVKPDLLNFASNGNTYSIEAKSEQLEFVVELGKCKGEKIDIILSFFCLSCPLPENDGQARMDGIMTEVQSPDALVRDVLIGGGCFEVNNITPIGIGQMAKFTGGASSIGFDEGVIISTGAPSVAHGPNNIPNAGSNNGGGGDVDLGQLSGPINDASGVQFYFTPTVEQIAFNYVFASEEYCEFSQSNFNDVFGFFISGPGINGTFSMQGENIAVLPGTGVAVSINTVNQFTNTAYYVDNTPQGQPQFAGTPSDCDGVTMQDGVAVNDCQYDGFTGTLTAVANVIPCETYLIRLVVGDVADGIYDSAVLLEANSFSAGGQGNVAADIPGLSPEGYGVAFEGCSDGFLVFNRVGTDLSEPVEIIYTIDPLSTGTPGVDFTDLPGSIIIPPGETQVLVPFSIYNDFITEGLESLILNIENACSCSQSTITILFDDLAPLQAIPENFSFCQAQPVTLTAQPSGGATPYTYEWSTGLTSSSITVNPFETETYYVTITDNCGTQVISEHLVEVTGAVGASLIGDLEICGGFPEGYLPIDLFGDGPWDLVYSFNGEIQPVIENIIYAPYDLYITEPGVYQLILVSTNGCPGNAQGLSIVTVNELDFIVEPEDPTCADQNNGSINLIPIDGTPGYGYQWTGTDQNNSNPTDLASGTYTVTVVDALGCEGDTIVNLIAPDSLAAEIVDQVDVNCLNPNGGAFNVNVSGGSPNYTVSWEGDLNNGTSQTNLSPGVYNGLIIDSVGCEHTISTEILADLETPIAVASALDVFTCSTQEVTLSAAGSSVDSIFSYEWFDGSMTSIGTGSEQLVDQLVTYTLVVTNTSNGCTEMTTVTPSEDIVQPQPLVVDPEILDCDTDEVLLDASGSTGLGAISYEWIFNNEVVGNEMTLLVETMGTYTLVITNDGNGCSNEIEIPVSQDLEIPMIDAGADQVLSCAIDNVTLIGTGSQGSNFSLNWEDSMSNDLGSNNSLLVTEPGTYTLVITNLTNGCSNADQVDVTPDTNIPDVMVDEDGTITCDNPTATLIGTGSAVGTDISYTWTNETGGIVSEDLIATVFDAGNYTLTVFNGQNGCEDSLAVTVPEDLNEPDVEAGPGGLLTCTQDQIELVGSTSNQMGHTFQWQDSDGNVLSNNAMVTVDQAGDFTFIVTAPNGCSSEDITTVDLNNDVPTADAGDNFTLTCNFDSYTLGGPNTSIDPNLEYIWLDADNNLISTDPTHVINGPGTFTLYVNDPISNCESFDDVVILEDILLPIIEVGQGGTINCEDFSFILGGTNSSQGSEFIYTWQDENNNIVSQDIFYETFAAGEFTLTILNTINGCEDSESISIYENVQDPIAAAGPNGILSCDVDFVNLSANGSSIGTEYGYEWFNGGGVLISESASIDVDETGEYTLIVTNLINKCTSTDIAIVTPDVNLPVAFAGPPQILNCDVGQVTLSAVGSSTASGEIDIQWLDPDGTYLSDQLEIQTSQAGIYTLVIVDNSNGCEANATVNVEEDFNEPIVQAGDDQVLDCGTDMLVLLGTAAGSGTFSFEWSDSDNFVLSNSQNVNIDQAGTYTFTVVDLINGCSSSDEIIVEPDLNAPQALAGPDGDLDCDQSTFEINASASSGGSGIIYQWTYQGAVIGSDLIFEVNQPGTYTLLVTDTNNSCETEDNVIITQDIQDPSAVIQQIGAASLDCDNLQVVLDGINSTPFGNVSFEWTLENNPTNILGNSSSLEVTDPGTYVLFVENLQNGCVDEIPFEVFQNIDTPDPSVADPDILTCFDQSLVLNVTDQNALNNIDILWETNVAGGILSDPTLSSISVGQPGTYNVTLINPANGCNAETNVEVISNDEYPNAVANVFDELNCVTDAVGLSGDGSSADGNYQYSWIGPSIIAGANTLNPTVNEPGIYQIEVFDLDNGCKTYEDIEVFENTDVPVDLMAEIDPPPCYNDPGAATIVAVDGGAGPYQYALGAAGGYTSNPVFENLFPGTYTVYIIDSIGCTYEESISVPGTNPIQAVLEGEIQISLGENTQLNTILTFPANEVTSIIWTPTETLSCDDCLNPFANPIENTIYTLMVTDANGCPAQDDVLVRVRKDRAIYIPNVFSPNDDGSNDIFNIFANNSSVEEVEEFIVVGRWGEIVFKDEGFMPNDPAHGWDGLMLGEPMNPGVFVYYARVKFIDGETEEYKGDVTLLK